MADRPTNKSDLIPEEPKVTGGWRKPSDVSGGWRTPESKPAVEGWRVPALPADLDTEPESEGAWHVPAPEDTIFSPNDEIEVKPERTEEALVDEVRPEDMLLEVDEAEEATPTETMPTAEALPKPEEGEQQAVETDESTGAAVSETAANPDDSTELGNLLELEATNDDDSVEVTLAPQDEDDDEGAFSMSELMALSSLVENQPSPGIVPVSGDASAVVAASPAEQALMGGTGAQPAADVSADDPADYARRQLAMLSGGTGSSPAVSTSGAASPAQSSADDPGDYARRQLAMLSGGTGSSPAATGAQPSVTLSDSAVMATSGLTPEQQDLVRRFRETQEQVRALRSRFQTGEITRDELQAQLRQLMILDENRVWWMMGVETDTWYKFDNGDWVVATPPYGGQSGIQSLQPGRGAPPTATSGLNASEVIGGSLPYFASEPNAPITEHTQMSGAYGTPLPSSGFGTEEMPLPQKVPIQDPDLTMVSPGGAYLDAVRRSDADTLAGVSRVPAETIVNPAVNLDQYAAIPAPGPTDSQGLDTAPDYDIEQAAPTYEEIAERQRQETVSTVLRLALVAVGVVLLIVAGILGIFLVSYNGIAGEYQTQIAALASYRPAFQTVRVLDMNGDEIAEINSQEGGARTSVPLDRISPFVIHAVVSLENERFFDDPGWDWVAIARAFAQNLGSGQVESGASTITQQIAEQLIIGQPTNTPDLKLREIIIAAEIAKQYTKQQILELYLNQIFFGNQSYGVEAAAQFYFEHSANELNLPESALLAGIIAAPAIYNPVRTGDDTLTSYNTRRDSSFTRMDFVINRMQQVGCLTYEEGAQPICIDSNVVRQAAVQKAEVVSATYEPREVRFRYPHFVQFVQAQVERLFGSGEMFRRGFVIKTTLNPNIQDIAENALQQQIAALTTTGVNTGSVMVTDPRTGAIRAMVGSPDFNNEDIAGQVNGALTWQQPGSAIKPILYTGALEGADRNGDGILDYMTPGTVLWDVPTTFPNTNPPYTPTNFDGQFWGPIAVRYALQNSRNVPAVKTLDFIGAAKFQEVANRMGLNFLPEAQFGLASALGANEVTLYDMMVAFGTLANNGVRTSLYTIDSITDINGQPILLAERTPPAQVVQPSVAFLMDNILSDDNARAQEFGLNGPLTIRGLPTSNYVAAKTGTTNQNRDLWTMGYTRNAVTGVWLGRADNNPTFIQGGGYQNVAPLWNQVMTAALQTMPQPEAFNPPGDGSVVQAQICPDTGTLPTPNCTSLRAEYFLGNQPPPPASQAFVQQLDIDTWTGLRANEFCPDNRIGGTFVNIPDPAAVAWLNTPAGRAVAQRLGLTDATIDAIPTGACDINTEIPIARIVSPAENQVLTGVVQITGSASASTFNRYQLEVAPVTSPNTFTIISGPTTVPQTSGSLGQWDTRGVANGTYIMRLSLFSNGGGYLYRMVQVAVNNVVATPTSPPILVPTSAPIQNFPTQAPIFSATSVPLPFEEVTLPPP
jgi:membrane peptidoglycan carboxypeptidase